MSKIKLATVWLDGCSGCHMSILDMDERLVELSAQFDLVFSPLVDAKTFPEGVDVALVEGAVSSEEDLHKIRMIRAKTKTLVSLGDCAVTGNVPAMRNAWSVDSIFKRVFWENATAQQQAPSQVVPKLLPRVRPVHEVVDVDLYVPGCPPSADTIHTVLVELLAGRTPDVASLTRFGV
ncbi:MAG: NADP oxidoreductase [Candidatus Acidiferrales bacterium]